jgi:hypothetical protein
LPEPFFEILLCDWKFSFFCDFFCDLKIFICNFERLRKKVKKVKKFFQFWFYQNALNLARNTLVAMVKRQYVSIRSANQRPEIWKKGLGQKFFFASWFFSDIFYFNPSKESQVPCLPSKKPPCEIQIHLIFRPPEIILRPPILSFWAFVFWLSMNATVRIFDAHWKRAFVHTCLWALITTKPLIIHIRL